MAGKAQGWQPSISDDAVKAKTGRNWMGWFAILNRANANALPHKQVAQLLHEKYQVPGWWAQMITVEYERARGGRQRNEQAGGFSVSVSKTFAVPLSRLYAAAGDAKFRELWFPGAAFKPSSQTTDKYFRGPWDGSGARLEIGFYAKGEGKSQIAIQVNKLSKKSLVEAERARWKRALENLADVLIRMSRQ